MYFLQQPIPIPTKSNSDIPYEFMTANYIQNFISQIILSNYSQTAYPEFIAYFYIICLENKCESSNYWIQAINLDIGSDFRISAFN